VGDLVTEPTPGFRQTLTGNGGFTHPALIGYGGGSEQLIALSVIVVGLASFFFTRRVQLGIRGKRLWRDLPGRPARAAETVRSAP
jgi:hypothetical protein